MSESSKQYIWWGRTCVRHVKIQGSHESLELITKVLRNCYLSLQIVAYANRIIILQLFNGQYVNTIITREIAVHYV